MMRRGIVVLTVLHEAGSLPVRRSLDEGSTPDLGGISGSSVACGSETEMFVNGVGFIGATCCEDGSETCNDGGAGFPQTCKEYGCARAVARVDKACAGFFNSNSFSTGQQEQISALAKICSATPPPPGKILGLEQLAGQTTNACGATLTDGISDVAGIFERYKGDGIGVTFEAPPGQYLEVDFSELVLPEGYTLTIHDGFDNLSPVAKSFTGHEESVPVRTSDWLLYVQLNFIQPTISRLTATGEISTGDGAALATRSMGFVASITCRCSMTTPNSCGPHGECESSSCHCDDGYVGDFCDKRTNQGPGTLGPPPIPKEDNKLPCDSCAGGWSCLDGSTGACWPDKVALLGQLTEDPFGHSGFLGLYNREPAAQSCTEAVRVPYVGVPLASFVTPVYRREEAWKDDQGTAHPGFMFMVSGLLEDNKWSVGIGDLDHLDRVNCRESPVSGDVFKQHRLPVHLPSV